MAKKKPETAPLSITATPVKFIETMAAWATEKEPGDYFVMVPGVGIVRCRKSSQISWQLFGLGITKAKLKEICAVSPHANVEFVMVVHPGEYSIDLIQTLFEARRAEKAGAIDPPAGEEETETDQEEAPATKKGKKKDKAPAEDKNPGPALSKKVLEKEHKEKAVKTAFKAVAIWDKATRKDLFGSLIFEDGLTTMNNIINDLEKFTGQTLQEETIKTIADNL